MTVFYLLVAIHPEALRISGLSTGPKLRSNAELFFSAQCQLEGSHFKTAHFVSDLAACYHLII